MRTSSQIIASETSNCSFSFQSLEKFLAMMAIQQTQYSDISYKANGPFALVLRAKKNEIEEVALKVLECSDSTECQIKAMEREYAICKQLPSSDYFVAVQDQFYLSEMDESDEKSQSENANTMKKVFFVQQMEMCQESLFDIIQHYSDKNKDPPTEEFKELLAIQMLDAVNLLHQMQIAHGNITPQHFLFSQSLEYPVLLKLNNLRFISSFNLKSPANLVSQNEPLNYMPPIAGIQKDCLDKDLVSLGRVLFQLDNIGSKGDYSRTSASDLGQPEAMTTFETHQLNLSTQLYQIACTLLNNSRENSQSARSMLLVLLQKQTSALKIPLFSVVVKNQIDALRLPIPSKRIRLDYLTWSLREELKLHSISSWFNNKGKRETKLTVDLLKSALDVMLEWKEFSGYYDVLGVGVGGVIFGVDNLKESRKSALKLCLCTNKAETMKEIGIMRMCQAPCIIKFYWYTFFKDANGNEFVVYEFEKCKYSLIHHLELQRMNGEYSDQQKLILTEQIIDSVRFLHGNGILHRNIKIDKFLITENGSGQVVVKLSNFSHAVQLQDNFKEMSSLEEQLLRREYESPVNCILQRHNRESPLYFAPERWENPDLSTYLTDSYSVGLCIFLLGNWILCSEEQLARKLFSVRPRSTAICCNIAPSFSTKAELKRIVKLLIMPQPQSRKSLRNLTDNYTPYKNLFEQKTMLTIKNHRALDEYKLNPMRFFNLYNISLNLNSGWIGVTEAKSLLNLISTLLYLSKISLNITSSSMLAIEAKSLLSPLAMLINLSSLSLNLCKNNIGNIESQFLLSPLANLLNLSSITLDLSDNQIGDKGAQSLLSPLANLLNLSSISLNLSDNQIGDKGAQSLLSPLANLLNLSSITLDLSDIQIGDKGAQSLLSPSTNLLNLSSITLQLYGNQIGDKGAQSLLSPFANLLNLSSIALDLSCNQIGDKGAQSLLSPFANLLNLSSIALDLSCNQIGHKGAQYLLSPFANLLNLSGISLNLSDNQIGDKGAQSLLSSLANLLILSSITLQLYGNQIGDKGAQSLLSPLANLLNLSSITLNLKKSQIGDKGAQSLLSPFANLLNLSNIILDLSDNYIEDKGAQSLLSPLANLLSLSSITLDLSDNQIGDKGAQSLLSSLANLLNLSSIILDLSENYIGDKGAQSLLSPLANHLNLSSISLNLWINKIGDKGAQSLLSPLANLLNLSSIILNLSDNQIGYKGAYSLFQHISNLNCFSSLSLQLQDNSFDKITNHLFENYLKQLKFLVLED